MDLESLVGVAHSNGASDLHLEAGLPAALRVRGTLRTLGEPIPPRELAESARNLLGEDQWQHFLEKRSCDLSRNIRGVRCRINVLQTARGVGFAVRLLASFTATVEKLNLHPDLKKLVTPSNGLILVSGPTGCGKSSTLAALIQEINLAEARHIVTIESPIEYTFRPRRAYIRQREVGRDTPSFEQALLDALREDPDVLMVGELREPETMRLTLHASETGHLVLATVHSANCAEALQRIVGAFPAEIQSNVAAQLADCLVAVIAQKLRFRPELSLRLPECEILTASHAARTFIRNRDFFKLNSCVETGAEHGMWSWARYRAWLDARTTWYRPEQNPEPTETEFLDSAASAGVSLPSLPRVKAGAGERKAVVQPSSPASNAAHGSDRIEIEPVEGEFGKILKRPGEV